MNLKILVTIIILAAGAVGISYYANVAVPAYQSVSSSPYPAVLPPPGNSPNPTASPPPIAADSSCARPNDEFGARYEELKGVFVRIEGNLAVVKGFTAAAETSERVTADALNALKNIPAQTPITLVAYVSNSTSGAAPPYSCLEINTPSPTDPPASSRIKVISPNGGEQLPYGSTQTIRWSAPSAISEVSISLLTWYPTCDPAALPPGQVCAGFATPPPETYTITSSTANDGSFEWVLPANYSAFGFDSSMGNYVVKIQAGQDADASDSPFTLN